MTSTQAPDVAAAGAIAARAKERTDAVRAERRPGRIGASIDTFGRTTRLGVSALRYAITDIASLRFPLREMLTQAWFIITVTAIPGILMAIPFGVIVSTQVGNLVHQLGASSMIGAAGGMGVIKRDAPVATCLLLGGAGAAAIAADLGARTTREEIDAMRVMGVDPVQRLVAPRVIAMLVVAPLINILIIAVGIVAGYLVAVSSLDVTPGSYWMSFGAFATSIDVWVSLLKSMIFGLLVVVVGCQRGLEAKGGPRGVADGVNAAVVLSVVAIMVVNTGITQVVNMFYPMRMG